MERMKEYNKIIFIESISKLTHVYKKHIYISSKESLIILPSPKSRRELIYINLDNTKLDFWEYEIANNKITILPSIDFIGKHHNAHFYIIDSKVYFVE